MSGLGFWGCLKVGYLGTKGFRVWGLGFRVSGVGFRVSGFGVQVQDVRLGGSRL